MITLILGLVVAAIAVGIFFFVRMLVPSAPTVANASHVELSSIDMDQLTSWVVKHLPQTVSGTLSEEDVRRIAQWNMDFIRSKRATSNGHATKAASMVIVAGAETVDYVLEQAHSIGVNYTAEQVHAVLDVQMAYLESIGAAGPELPPE